MTLKDLIQSGQLCKLGYVVKYGRALEQLCWRKKLKNGVTLTILPSWFGHMVEITWLPGDYTILNLGENLPKCTAVSILAHLETLLEDPETEVIRFSRVAKYCREIHEQQGYDKGE